MNTNCLEGLKCPECGYEDEILVYAEMWVSLTDDGTDSFADSLKHRSDVAYDENRDAECPNCQHVGRLKEWRITKQRKKEVKR